MPRQVIETDRIAPLIGPFSAAVLANGFLYLSGQIGLDPETARLVEGGVTEQTRQVLVNIEQVLVAAGKSMGDVVKVNVYLADMNSFSAMNEEYARHFEAPFPARTTIEAARLPLGALVEMEAVAQ